MSAAPPVSPTDQALLRAFAAGAQASFAELVRRHERMVYSTALRCLDGDASAAQDAAQQTFLLLARHAARLRPSVIIGGWLHHAACHQAHTLRRSMIRRRLREEVAATDPSLSPGTHSAPASETEWGELSPEIDAALERLPSRLRDAVVLCFLQNQERPAAAAQLGCSPEALAKRLTRALEQLRAHFTRRGATVSTVALAALLSQHGSEAHAAGLAPAVLAASPAPAAPLFGGSFLLKSATGLAVFGAGLVWVWLTLPSESAPPFALRPASAHASFAAPAPATASAPARPSPAQASASTAPLGAVTLPQSSIPKSNPYAPALALYETWSAADRRAVWEGQNFSPAALASVPVFAACLKAGLSAPDVDWGVNRELGFYTTLPHISAVWALVRATLKAGETLPEEVRFTNALGVLALGRHIGPDGALIELGIGYAVSREATAKLEAMLPILAPSDAQRAAEAIRALPPGASLATALAAEKVYYWDSLVQALHTELFSAIGPAAKLEISFPQSSPDAQATPATADEVLADSPSLRLSGVLQDNGATAISLESPQGSFWLRPGETRDELTLLEANVARRRATLLFRGRPLLLDLESKRFSMPAIAALEAAARRLPPDSLCAEMLKQRPSGSIADFFRETQATVQQVNTLFSDVLANPALLLDEPAYHARYGSLAGKGELVDSLPRYAKSIRTQEERLSALLTALDARAAEAESVSPGSSSQTGIPLPGQTSSSHAAK